jgi:ATP-dependent RNA helicase DDX46/PRP5
LKRDAEEAHRASARASQPNIGRIYYSDVESGVMEEAARTLDVVNAASVDALEVLADLNKKKELKAVDHSILEYLQIKKNLYLVPRSIASLTADQVMERRAKFKIRVRGKGAPAPVATFEECGLSERILQILKKMKVEKPFAVQSQCLPCIMAGRDVIGIAKTGSGKTLAYLLPMLRHIADQPPLEPHETGPIGLVLAPARELAVQIYHVAKVFAKQLGLK